MHTIIYFWQFLRREKITQLSWNDVRMYVNEWLHKSQRQDVETTKFCLVAPNTCESSVWDWHHVSRLGPRRFGVSWIFFFLEIFCFPV